MRKEANNIFGFDRNGTNRHITLGILGCDAGVGTTHLAISLCTYCASKQRKSVAYVELHARSEIAQLVPETALLHERPFFRLYGVDYYPRLSGSEIPVLLNQGYQYLIMDTGSLGEANESEFLRCDRKLVLGNLSPWKRWKYEAFFQHFHSINLGEGFDFLVQTGVNENVLHFSKTHHIAISQIPFIQNPFRIEKELFPFLERRLLAP